MSRLFSVLAAAVAMLPGHLASQSLARIPVPIPNGSFETGTANGKPTAWLVRERGIVFALDTLQPQDGGTSLRSQRTSSVDSAAGSSGSAAQTTPLSRVLGTNVRLSGWIRTENVENGMAALWIRTDSGSRIVRIDNMSDRPVVGTTPWTRYTVKLYVDTTVTAIYFGVLHAGSGTAWFDSLTLEVVGDAATVSLPPRPVEDMTRLLTDAELAVVDSNAPSVDPAAGAWVRAHAHPIRSLGADDFSDLTFLRPLLDGKRIVQLGESGHGVREFNLVKVRLIKYLHEELGYDVLAFESSLYACDRTGRAAGTLSAEQLMRGCIFGVWWTNEVLPLFEYLKATRSTSRRLVLTGFDTQESSWTDRTRAAFLRRVVAAVDTSYGQRVHLIDSTWSNSNASPGSAPSHPDGLPAFYDSLAAWIDSNKTALAAAFPGQPQYPALARQAALSMSAFARQREAGRNAAGTEIRDRGMADNLDFVLDVLHPGKKVIVWGHNAHIQHGGFGAEEPPSAPRSRTRMMGSWIAERRRHELYTIGLYMYRGAAASNDQRTYRVGPAFQGTLEAILHRAPWKYSFVDLSRAPHGPGTAWMHQPLVVREWGTNATTIVPRDEYDGLLFIDTTWPPDYLIRLR